MTGFLRYKTYSFVDKDPVIDQIRTIINDEKLVIGDIAEAAGVRAHTISKWLYGDTKRPQFATLCAVLRAMGFDFRIVRLGQEGVIDLKSRRQHKLRSHRQAHIRKTKAA